MEALFQPGEVITVVRLMCAMASTKAAAGLLEGGEKHNGGGGGRKRADDIISPGLLRSSPVEG